MHGLSSALENLMMNAVKFSPAGETVLTEAEVVGADLQLRVSDRGPGLPDGHHEGVFDKFVALGAREKRGFGLGLYLVRLVAQAHGGRAEAHGGTLGGTQFTLSIPHTTS